jgi:hypothetical protein
MAAVARGSVALGKEYAAKRGLANVRKTALQAKTAQKASSQTKTAQKAKLEPKKRPLVARNDPAPTKSAKPAKPPKVSSLQNRASVQR